MINSTTTMENPANPETISKITNNTTNIVPTENNEAQARISGQRLYCELQNKGVGSATVQSVNFTQL